jgi:hypothetical protein
VALLLLLVLATMDFPFLNPAVLGSLVLTTVIAARWSEVEALDRKA